MNYHKTDYFTTKMRIIKFAIGAILLALVLTSSNAFAAGISRLDYARMEIDEILMTAPEFSTFSTLLPGTDLEAKLKKGGLVTVFAPSNEAFATVDTVMLMNLLEDKKLLNNIMNLHWTDRRAYSGYFYNERWFAPHEGIKLPVVSTSRATWIGNAKIVVSDISTRTGIIHIIDKVIMPSEQYNTQHSIFTPVTRPRATTSYSPTIGAIQEMSNDGIATRNAFDTLNRYDSFSVFTDLIEEAGLKKTLSSPNAKVTIFAPTNQAFEKFDGNKIVTLKRNPVALMQMILTHVVPQRVTEDDMRKFIQTKRNLNSSILRFSQLNSPLVENARIVSANLEATNGIIHAIDRVIQIKR